MVTLAALPPACEKWSGITPNSLRARQLNSVSPWTDDDTRAEIIVDPPSYSTLKMTDSFFHSSGSTIEGLALNL